MRRSFASSAGSIPWWFLWIGLAAFSVAVIGPAYLNHDDAWYLHMARVMLHGGTLYRDVVDTNPPLIVVITAPAVWLAERIGANAVPVFKTFVFALELIVALACVRWVPATSFAPVTSLRLMTTVLVFAMAPFAGTGEFGQREHVMVLLVLPYVLRAAGWLAAPDSRQPGGWAAGIAGGLGFAMKPYYLLAWVGIETSMYFMSSRRATWRRADAVWSAIAIAGYGLLVVTLTPQYLKLAIEVTQVYVGPASPMAFLLRIPDLLGWVFAAAAFSMIRVASPLNSLARMLFVAWTAFLVAALVQMKGFNYHLYPARVFMWLFATAVALAILDTVPTLRQAIRGGVATVVVAAVALMALWSARQAVASRRPAGQDLVTPLVDIVRDRAPDGPLAMLSMATIMYPAFPVVNYTGAAWSMRHNALWFLPGLYTSRFPPPADGAPFRTPETMPALEREFYEEVISDLCAAPPALLLIERPARPAEGARRAFDLREYYAQDDRYRRLATAYRPLNDLGPFTIFQRVQPASCTTRSR